MIYTLPTTTPGGVARASKFLVSKVGTGGGGETRGSLKRHGHRAHFVECSSFAAAQTLYLPRLLTTEPRRSIMRARAASMAPRAASPCTADGVAATLSMRLRPWAGIAQMSRATPWHAWTAGAAALRAGRRRAPLYAIDATPHKFRQQPELRLAAPRPASLTRPLRLRVRILQPRPVVRRPEHFRGRRRKHACFGWGSRGLNNRLVHASFSLRQGGRVARGQAAMITGFFVTPCKYGEFAKKQLCAPPIRYPKRQCRSPR